MSTPSPLFPISRIAALLGVDRKTVRQQFEGVSPNLARPMIVAGQNAVGWPVSAFPPRLHIRLEKAARDQGYEDIERFLSHARDRWSHKVPLGKLPQCAIDQARARCDVLAPILRRRGDLAVSEITREALAAWKSGSRHLVTEWTMRRWIERAMERDRGFRDWSRWEIFLDDKLTAATGAASTEAAELLELPNLAGALAAVKQPAALTSTERTKIWLETMKDADALEAAKHPPITIQRAVLLAVAASGVVVAKTPGALRKAYLRKREAWVAGGRRSSTLRDHRADAAKKRVFDLPDSDKIAVLRLCTENGGRLAVAWRQAIRRKVLSEGTLAHFSAAPADKSHVPHSVRRAVGLASAVILPHHQGPRHARLNGPWTNRDWSDIEPGDWWVGDDLTPPVYWWEETEKGPVVMRGQLLMLADAKSDYPLGWVLLSSRSYNSRAIRSLITRCHDEHGLPRKGFHFEYGIWEQSKILTGAKRDPHEVALEDTEEGLEAFGSKFTHATTPGQKTIERLFGLLQNRMEGIPGYCGRDERRDCPESTRHALADVNSGREHPAKFFLEKTAFCREIEKIVAEHAAEKYGPRSRKIPNQSPAEVYRARRTEDIIHLDDRSRYLLANHRMIVKVGRNGIQLRPSLGGGLYRNEETGRLIGQKVLAWIDVDAPEVITITTLDREMPCLVEREHEPRALGAEPWEKRAAVKSRQSHAAYGAGLYKIVAGGNGGRFRSVVVDRETVRLGAEMERQKAARTATQRDAANLSAQFERLTASKGLDIPKPDNPEKLRAVVAGLRADDQHWRQVRQRAAKDVDL